MVFVRLRRKHCGIRNEGNLGKGVGSCGNEQRADADVSLHLFLSSNTIKGFTVIKLLGNIY